MERALFERRIRRGAAMRERRHVAARFLRGEGVEIGALHIPLDVPRGVRVRYVDRFDTATARSTYPELRMHKLAEVGVVDDGETLATFAPESLDFIVANHMIEHCENPLATIENWLGKLKSGGVIFMAVPDKVHTFDRDRLTTTTEHLLGDWREGGEGSLLEHYRDWARHVSHLQGEQIEICACELLQSRENIHFHVWRLPDFVAALLVFRHELCARHGLNRTFDLEFAGTNNGEFLIVLKKA